MKRSFDLFMETLKNTIADYKYYTDFNKVYRNVLDLKIELNILNSLIGSKDIENDFIKIINDYPKTLKAIPILIAVRNYEISIIDETEVIFNFKNKNLCDEMYLKFMRETGLFDLMENNKVKCLLDYVTGVEVGMDTNAKKNRTGSTMENIVCSYIKKVKGVKYYQKMKKSELYKEFSIDLDKLITFDKAKKDAEKEFDFVVKTNDHLFLIETNFYTESGSKLNETARSYKSLAKDFKNLENISFVWITDGKGWNSAKDNLYETYNELEHIYNLYDLENGIFFEIFK